MSKRTKIGYLTPDNWPVWKEEMRAVLIECDYIDALTPSRLTAEQKTNKIEEKARAAIILSAGPANFDLYNGKETASAVWAAFEAAYSITSKAKVVKVRRSLMTITKGHDETMQHYFARADAMRLLLSAAGKPVNDSDYKMTLLAGLSRAYDTVVEAISDWIDMPTKTPTDVLARLLATEARLDDHRAKKQEGRNGEANAAFVSRRRCYECGKPGHIAKFCNTPRCNYCNEFGHSTEECRKKTRDDKRRGETSVADSFTF